VTAPYRKVRDGVLLDVRVTPKSAAARLAGLHTAADGMVSLAIKVTAPPDKGKANAAVIGVLAEAFGLPKSTLSIAAGETSRRKTVHISGNPEGLAPRIEAALKTLTAKG
jgi:uncharacterized protein (TIGR00251 family)